MATANQGHTKRDSDILQRRYNLESSLCDFAPTLSALWGLPRPSSSEGGVLDTVVAAAKAKIGAGRYLKRTLLFCPDAIGETLHRAHGDFFVPLAALADVKVSAAAMMPSCTPVCFGTIFSGATPSVHGIQAYMKPVLTVETLHNTFTNAGLRVISIAVNECSIDRIFRGRDITYISTRTDDEAFETTRRVLARDEHDLIVCYDSSYDTIMHKLGCRAPESLEKAELAVARYRELLGLTDETWSRYDRLVAFVPDHGAHDDAETGKGRHGDDIFDDIAINHYYRFSTGQ